ncbi:MAG: MoxR family ATPase [bacterium]
MINRLPKTQSALLEAMQERCVTLDGHSHELGDGFMVVATQNPIEQEGTYPLPEAQLDRFLFRIRVATPRAEELAMVRLHGHKAIGPTLASLGVTPLFTLEHIRSMRRVVSEIRIADSVVEYIVDLVRETRQDAALMTGASPRSANMLATASTSKTPEWSELREAGDGKPVHPGVFGPFGIVLRRRSTAIITGHVLNAF